jgi:hypothetical protein
LPHNHNLNIRILIFRHADFLGEASVQQVLDGPQQFAFGKRENDPVLVAWAKEIAVLILG